MYVRKYIQHGTETEDRGHSITALGNPEAPPQGPVEIARAFRGWMLRYLRILMIRGRSFRINGFRALSWRFPDVHDLLHFCTRVLIILP